MDPASATFAWLRGPEAFALRRAHAAPPGTPPPDPVALQATLRRELPADRARALASQIELERRAAAKFERPEALLFEREALEQASSAAVARRHAGAVPGGASVLDLGCGLGADAMAFAAAGARVVAVDRGALPAALCAHNLGTVTGPAGRRPRALAIRGEADAPPARTDVLFLDPDRRTRGRRVARLAATEPSAATIAALRPRFAAVLLKAPAALPDGEIPADADVEFLSEDGTVKEAFLRFGAGAEPGRRAAVLLREGLVRRVESGPPAPVAPCAGVLLDPDPALRRAGGVDGLADELGAARVAPGVSYLVMDVAPRSPWVRAYAVRETFVYRPRELARRLGAAPTRELVVKQRGAGLDEARLRRGLSLDPAGAVRVLVVWSEGMTLRAALCDPPIPDPTPPGPVAHPATTRGPTGSPA